MMLEQLTPAEIMDLTPAQVDAIVWVEDQCESCVLAGVCDQISREMCGGALRGDNAGE
jgi:hypothetical protein